MTSMRSRTMARVGFALLVAALLATAAALAELEFLTAALLAAVGGIALDVRQTAQAREHRQ